MKSTKLLLTCGLALGCIFMLILPSSCDENNRAKTVAEYNVSDQVAMPDTIIFHHGGKNMTIAKGTQFNKIVSMTNARLKGAQITENSLWTDSDATPLLSGIETIEFDYSQIQTSSFEYDGFTSVSVYNETQLAPPTIIKYTKLIFPLIDESDYNKNDDNFSLSVFSYGDPTGITSGGGCVFQTYPISQPNYLGNFLKNGL